ncbi:MAG: LytTR family DNA-binding domain-containing protein [Duganella sp.]
MAGTVLIVDDEAHARTNLRLALAPMADWIAAADCASAAAARAVMATHAVDLILLDVQMPVESGLDLARELSRLERPPLIVFVTAHRGHALDAFEVHALDYLLKPVDDRRLRQALARARVLLDQRATYTDALRQFADPAPAYWQEVIVRSVGRMDKVDLAEVRWIEAAGNYVELHMAHATMLHRTPLAALERYLDPQQFLRIHRRMLVRRGQLAGLRQGQEGGYTLALRCGHELPVSERYVAAAKAALRGELLSDGCRPPH